MTMITLRSGFTVGQGAPVRVNCNIGCNSEDEYLNELNKIKVIKESRNVQEGLLSLKIIIY